MPVSELSPNPRRSTVEYIADELRDAIMAGRLEPGEQLGEADLARRFEVSRGPLREAMQRLVSEGLLHAITNRGVFVTELTLEDVVPLLGKGKAKGKAHAKKKAAEKATEKKAPAKKAAPKKKTAAKK